VVKNVFAKQKYFMNLQLHPGCVRGYPITSTPQIVTVSPTMVPLPNVVVIGLYTFNGSFGYFKHDFMVRQSMATTVTVDSEVNLVAALKPEFISEANGVFTFDFGVGDGTGQDFSGDEGARVEFTFHSASNPNQYAPHVGATKAFPLYPFNSNVAREYLLHLDDSHFNGLAASNKSVTITVPNSTPGSLNSRLIEQMVELHIFDKHGALKCIMDIGLNQTITVNYETDGFTMAAFIKGHPDSTNSANTIFEIGDPITDASVSVSSRNP
jgi:hypothetical protein